MLGVARKRIITTGVFHNPFRGARLKYLNIWIFIIVFLDFSVLTRIGAGIDQFYWHRQAIDLW
jgi:hypothetical protein